MRHARILALLVIAAAALAGCGSATQSSGGENGVEVAAVQSPLNGAKSADDFVVKSSDTITNGKPPRIVSYPTGIDNDEVSETGTLPTPPCSLVSRDKASAILGGSVRSSEEDQGPTCVYQVEGSAKTVTVVVEETTNFAVLRNHARNASRVQVAGETGWCLRYGSTSIAVPLDPGHVLHVTGPCDEAQRFASLALPRLPD